MSDAESGSSRSGADVLTDGVVTDEEPEIREPAKTKDEHDAEQSDDEEDEDEEESSLSLADNGAIVPHDDNDDPVLNEEKQCLMLLLEARKLLGFMLLKAESEDRKRWEEKRLRDDEERRRTGRMTLQELQEMLKNSPEEDDKDLIAEIQELKRLLAHEVRNNHDLEVNLADLDKKIQLLIQNKTSIQEVMATKKRKTKKSDGTETDFMSNKRLVELYQEMFYLLQTEPQYLARTLFVVGQETMEKFLDTVVITLFGDAFSPREEYLVLQLFYTSIQREIKSMKTVGDFLQAESVVPKMVITYNRRTQGLEYLRVVLAPVLAKFFAYEKEKDLVLELDPKMIYHNKITEDEIRTGAKSEMDRNLALEEIVELPEIKKIISDRLAQLEIVCKMFIDGIIESLDKLPYGIRWICKQIRILCERNLKAETEDDIGKLIGYFVYYRFINLAIVTPDAFKVINKDLAQTSRKNLVVVAKVLQNVFNFRTYRSDHMEPINTFILEQKNVVSDYFDQLVQVDEPEEHLKINAYLEMAQKVKPVILVTLSEITRTHALIKEHVQQVAPDETDPLRVLMKEIGDVPAFDREADRAVQMTLSSKMAALDMGEGSAEQKLFQETKELLVPILRKLPLQYSITKLTLMDVLERGKRFADKENDKELTEAIFKILENIPILEKAELVSKADNYESIVHATALDVVNRGAVRRTQKKEIARLTKTLDDLKKHGKYIQESLADYETYLSSVKKKQFEPRKKKKRKEGAPLLGPFKFSFSKLSKMGVIVDSDINTIAKKTTTFIIVSEQAGVFLITPRVGGKMMDDMSITLEMEDLLQRTYAGKPRMELEQVTLDANMTLHMINKFLSKG